MTESEAGRRPSAQIRRAALLAAVLCVLLAGWFGWSGINQWRGDAREQALSEARDQAVQATSAALSAQLRQLAQRLATPTVQAALAAGDADAVAAAVGEGWKGVEEIAVLPADLAAPYRDAAAFGYARLGLLERALSAEEPVAAVVRDAGGARLGLASAVTTGADARQAVLYVRLPLSVLTRAFEQGALPAGTYLALRQGNHNVVERGDAGLAGSADVLSREVARTGLRAAAAVPDVDPAPLGLAAIPCLAVAGVLGLLAMALLLVAHGGVLARRRRRPGAAPVVDEEPTFGQTLHREGGDTARPAAAARSASPVADPGVVPGIFRAYDIRGVVGRELTPQVAARIGQAIGSVMAEQGLTDIVVGRDGRLSGPELAGGLIEGLRRAGRNVIDIGMAPTPVVYFAAYHLRAGSAVAVTGSHNPPDYNGFKVVVGGETLSGDAIADLYARIRDGRLHETTVGALRQQDVGDDYIQRIADDVQLERPLKVVLDAGNGVAGELGPRLLEAIGAEVIPLYCDVDGTFPNHHPDPSEPHNLEDLIQTVRQFDADLGVAFDGDGDRLGVVTREGKMIFSDRLLMLYASDVLQRNPGALVIYDVKCTGKLSDFILRNGGSPLMWKTGHSLVKAKMRETEAELAGEMSGHFFFKERWYGFDDGLYAAARLLEILAMRFESPSEVLAELPESVATPEIKVQVGDADPHALIAQLVATAHAGEESPFAGARLTTIDGLRADWNDGWGLLRASNTTPVLVLRFEADDAAALERIKAVYRAELETLLPGAAPGF
ncbi:phosphomannomutase/phosphoglucomutase [Xanthomonas sp. XNM01]|uniref:phosphomannomutase/phosphoglucomutase n=1 Tax=Xanthomonas sp. XNM01 TaxID=2769289 RepID=UPI001782FC76|nr:phosphomannomutase/phosphoglucomutase [Xanthomonas sp. XNM01]MBD9369864.1 phosphomannomutase/phosphoglucomutase [Xanthomonas sp. XNM01]